MKLISTLILTSFMSNAYAYKFECMLKHNYETIFQTKFELEENSSKKFGAFEEYEFTLKDTGDLFELELYNSLEPSRSYAIGDFKKSQDLGLIIWNREKLIEVSCKKRL